MEMMQTHSGCLMNAYLTEQYKFQRVKSARAFCVPVGSRSSQSQKVFYSERKGGKMLKTNMADVSTLLMSDVLVWKLDAFTVFIL